ncbi:MAG: hypothetical protein FWE95_05605 [Planctomycetaceae bacterium]|nr:hypothetical protein [Planctomycetaceae bacterium]
MKPMLGSSFVLPLFFLLAGCTKTEPPLQLTIIISGDTAGWIVPCGCASNQSGGLPRRGTFVEERRKQGPVILADVGGAASGVTLYDKLKFEAIVRGEAAMDIAVHNIGQAEALLGIDVLNQLHERWGMPWISANTTDAAGNPFAEPARTVTTGNRNILFIGVLSQQYATEEVRITPPRQSVLKVLREQSSKYDYAIVLAYMPEDELWELTENLPEVDAVVGGPTGQPVPPTYPQGSVLMTSATKQGKFLAVLTLPPDSERMSRERISGTIVDLCERFADDPVQIENVRKFYAELRRRDLAPSDTPFARQPLTPSEVYAGSRACQDCHDDEYRVWRRTPHANAWESLVRREAQYDPDCQRCHVTGYGLSGGFGTVSASEERFNVGCESCHGGSAEHCRVTSILTSVGKRAHEQCLICHDRENSPLFDFESYWEKIRHASDL